ncbi:MAG: 20, APCd gp20 [Pseudomonas sp.]|nr:20, APCd gp20 [Pseudomonas sp.]
MGNPLMRRLFLPVPPVEPLLPSPAAQRAERLASGHIVIVCGGRDYQDWERVCVALDRAHAKKAITLLVHGACMDRKTGTLLGADGLADTWARLRSVKTELHPANWEMWGKAAGPMRNKQMAEMGAHGCIAFPGGSGTASMIRQAEHYGVKVWRPYG